MAIERSPSSVDRIRYPEVELMNPGYSDVGSTLSGEIVEDLRTPGLKEGVVFVALGKDQKESDTVLVCALKLHEKTKKKICILHVHQPPERIPTQLGARFANIAGEDQIRAYNDFERRNMLKLLDKYAQTSEVSGVKVDRIWRENKSIEKGIVELILENGVKWLIMGGASSKYNPRKVKEIKSVKAKFVQREAPDFCHIWFVCQGSIIHTRPANRNRMGVNHRLGPANDNIMDMPPPSQSAPMVRSFSTSDMTSGEASMQDSGLDFHRLSSQNLDLLLSSSSIKSEGELSPQSPLNHDPNAHLARSPHPLVVTRISISSPGVLPPITEATENGSGLRMFCASDKKSLASSNDFEAKMGGLYINVQQSADQAEASNGHKKVETDVMDAIHDVKQVLFMRSEERKHRKEVDEALSRSKKGAEKARLLLDEVMEELRIAQEQNLLVESQIKESDRIVENLELKMHSADDLLQQYKQQRDELQIERDKAFKEAEELKKQCESSSGFFLRFTLQEIKEATNNFDPSLKIGEGVYGSVYRGNLRHTRIAVKMLNPRSSQGPLEFQQEVNALSKLRHPNIVTLIGACPEVWALIYEYVPNGSLEDHLKCKGNTPPLSWKKRISISTELCSALIFLHSCQPHGIVHCDLKPSNILLDGYCVSKLSDFGICRELPQEKLSENDTKRILVSNKLEGTLPYVDPELLDSGQVTSLSDVYSFGVVLLRVLTGKPAAGIIFEVQNALKCQTLNDILDPTAGDWPFVQAEQLAHLAIRCTSMPRSDRPNLKSEAWRVLESMKFSCGVASPRVCLHDHDQIPSYFICPIFQDIMEDPVVAADGFTYESEAFKGWLDSNHDTSPMTNLKLPQFDVIPNYALRSAIQEWQHRSGCN